MRFWAGAYSFSFYVVFSFFSRSNKRNSQLTTIAIVCSSRGLVSLQGGPTTPPRTPAPRLRRTQRHKRCPSSRTRHGRNPPIWRLSRLPARVPARHHYRVRRTRDPCPSRPSHLPPLGGSSPRRGAFSRSRHGEPPTASGFICAFY